jgi:hypothetical protein
MSKINKENLKLLKTPPTNKNKFAFPSPFNRTNMNINKINYKHKLLLSNFRTPNKSNQLKLPKLENSIKISKVKLRRESSLEKEFGYINSSKAFAPQEIFKIYPVIHLLNILFNIFLTLILFYNLNIFLNNPKNVKFEETCTPKKKILEFLKKNQYLKKRLTSQKFLEFVNLIFQRNHKELFYFSEKNGFTLFELFQDLSLSGNYEKSTFINGFAFLTHSLSQRMKIRQATFETDKALSIYTEILQKVT